MVAEKFVPSLESLSSLGFEERNLGCPGNLARRFTQRMDLRERSGVTCVNLHFRSVGVTCINLCLTTRPTGVKRAKNGCVKNYASERVERQRSNAGK